MTRNVKSDIDEALHMVIGAFLEGAAPVLVETAELMMTSGGGSSKSGLVL